VKQRIIITTLVLMTGFFVAGQVLGAGEYGRETGSKGYGAMMEESKQPGVAAHELDSCQVSRIQNILKDKGFDAGPSDGILGSRTSQALRGFQESEGLAVTGKPDSATLRALAPDTGTQEYFGISPEFDEKGMVEEQSREQMKAPEQKQGRVYEDIERMFYY
jgi:hypothetical protein